MREVTIQRDDSLTHYGIKGQKWGVRRYENEDGTLTEEGKARYRADAEQARKEIGAAARSPMSTVGNIEGKYMSAKPTGFLESVFEGGDRRKFRELDKLITNQTKAQAEEYTRTGWELTKAKTEKNAILFRKARSEAANAAVEEHRKAGKLLADAVASVSTQYISENFKEYDQDRAKAWVYSQYATEDNVREYFN